MPVRGAGSRDQSVEIDKSCLTPEWPRGPRSAPMKRALVFASLLGSAVLLQACLAATVAGVAADAAGAVVKGTVAVAKAVIPYNEPAAKG